VIAPEDAGLFMFAETAQEIWDLISVWWRDAGEEFVSPVKSDPERRTKK
jgi:hypothetical protein